METKEFKFENGLQLRVLSELENETVWFVGIDVCSILGYADAHQKIKSLDEDEYRLDRIIDGQGRKQETLTVNEFGLYSLILSSQKSEAKPFKRWITHEVLPAIRKTGKYTSEDDENYDNQLKNLASEIDELKNKRENLMKLVNNIKKSIDDKTTEMILLIKTDRRQLKLLLKFE
jgi:prophage antirepressor-like protein